MSGLSVSAWFTGDDGPESHRPRSDGADLTIVERLGGSETTPAESLPVTPAERAAADCLRAWQAWQPNMSDRSPAHSMLVAIGTAAVAAGFADSETEDLTPAGRDLLARVEAEERTERAQVVTFLRAEEERYRRNSKDPAHDEHGRERCANKASVLATVGRYIERGDHLAPPIAAPPGARGMHDPPMGAS